MIPYPWRQSQAFDDEFGHRIVGAVDEHGNFVDSHRIFAITLRHLVERRGWRGEVVKTFSVSQMHRSPLRPAQEVEAALASQGVLTIALDPHRLRLVTHHDVDDAGIEYAIGALQQVG
jgi:hypothetical protein